MQIFLAKYGLLVDINKCCLTSPLTNIKSSGSVRKVFLLSPSVANTEDNPTFFKLLKQFVTITKPTFQKETLPHSITHHKATTSSPVHNRPHRLGPKKLSVAKAKFTQMMEMSIIRPSNNNWVSPLHMVPKSGDTWHACGDYRPLNSATKPDRYPITNIHYVTVVIQDKSVFTKLYLINAYHQIPVERRYIPKTAITKPFGLFEFLRVPFGLRNAAQSFQRFINHVLHGLHFVCAYVNDVLIASSSKEEHIKHVQTLFERFEKNGVVINPVKWEFRKSEIHFLGQFINSAGIFPSFSQVEAIENFPVLDTTRKLRQFLGMIIFYRRFMPMCAQVVKPLTDMLTDLKNCEIVLSDIALIAFRKIKKILSQATSCVWRWTHSYRCWCSSMAENGQRMETDLILFLETTANRAPDRAHLDKSCSLRIRLFTTFDIC